MVPLMDQYAYLKEIVVATAAIHLVARRRSQGVPVGHELVDALSARAQAIKLLKLALDNIDESNRPAILAAVVFFVNFDLIDSGRGGWKVHLEAAGSLIRSLQGDPRPANQAKSLNATTMRLGDMVVADCLTYHILGSALGAPDEAAARVYDGIDVPAVLRRAQAHSYHCCPPGILQIVAEASRMASPGMIDGTLGGGEGADDGRAAIAANASRLLSRARAMDVRAWVGSIAELSADDDRETRVKLASAHRAAACLYVLLCVPSAGRGGGGPGAAAVDEQAGQLVDEILHHLSSIPAEHELFKGAVWPAFVAGGQTDDPGRREWCLGCISSLWLASSPWVCPWGYVYTAAETLQRVWAARDALPPGERARWNWLAVLRSSGEGCLIV